MNSMIRARSISWNSISSPSLYTIVAAMNPPIF